MTCSWSHSHSGRARILTQANCLLVHALNHGAIMLLSCCFGQSLPVPGNRCLLTILLASCCSIPTYAILASEMFCVKGCFPSILLTIFPVIAGSKMNNRSHQLAHIQALSFHFPYPPCDELQRCPDVLKSRGL